MKQPTYMWVNPFYINDSALPWVAVWRLPSGFGIVASPARFGTPDATYTVSFLLWQRPSDRLTQAKVVLPEKAGLHAWPEPGQQLKKRFTRTVPAAEFEEWLSRAIWEISEYLGEWEVALSEMQYEAKSAKTRNAAHYRESTDEEITFAFPKLAVQAVGDTRR